MGPGILTHRAIVPSGTLLIYSSAATHLLSVILAEATGMTTLQYAREKLLGPLGIATDPALEPPAAAVDTAGYDRAGFAWPRDPQGYHLGFGYLRLTALDMLKLGQLYLDNGRWLGRQIVPADYVRESTQAYASSVTRASFGYQWWLTAAQGRSGFAARGFGGQLVYVVPDLGLGWWRSRVRHQPPGRLRPRPGWRR